jgi:hypothetical protein
MSSLPPPSDNLSSEERLHYSPSRTQEDPAFGCAGSFQQEDDLDCCVQRSRSVTYFEEEFACDWCGKVWERIPGGWEEVI